LTDPTGLVYLERGRFNTGSRYSTPCRDIGEDKIQVQCTIHHSEILEKIGFRLKEK